MLLEWKIRKQPSVLGILSGAVSGIVAITPACGYVNQNGAFFIGLISGLTCYFGARLKHAVGYGTTIIITSIILLLIVQVDITIASSPVR